MSEGDEKRSYTQLQKAQTHILNQSLNFINSAALTCAVQLGIPDIIYNHGKPIKHDELVAALPIHLSKAPYVLRIMRLLVHSGFFIEEEESFSLTSSSLLLLEDEPFSARAFVMMLKEPAYRKPWDNMFNWLHGDCDSTPFVMTHEGMEFWDYVNLKEPSLGKVFNEAMASDSELIKNVLVNEDNRGTFKGLKSLVDVGGGTGTMAKAIARTFPNLKCIVFDLPQVVANLEGTENLEFVGGDMFEAIPPASATFLKWVLHDWNDEKCVEILKKCKEAIISSKEEGGKVIIVDVVLKNQIGENAGDESSETQLLLDMVMMANHGGRERNERGWATLFDKAGFSNYKVSPVIGSLRSLIEVYP